MTHEQEEVLFKAFKNLTTIFEMSPSEFWLKLNSVLNDKQKQTLTRAVRYKRDFYDFIIQDKKGELR